MNNLLKLKSQGTTSTKAPSLDIPSSSKSKASSPVSPTSGGESNAKSSLNITKPETLEFMFTPSMKGRQAGNGKWTVQHGFGTSMRVLVSEFDTSLILSQKVIEAGKSAELFRVEQNGPRYCITGTNSTQLRVQALPADLDLAEWQSRSEEWTITLNRTIGLITPAMVRNWSHTQDSQHIQSEGLGVSLQYLCEHFASLARGACDKADPTFHDLAPMLAHGPKGLGFGKDCPRDHRPNCSIVDALPSDVAGPATHFLSWAWGTPLGAFVSAMQSWARSEGTNPASTFVWACFLCDNQYRMVDRGGTGSDNLEMAIGYRLRKAKHLVVLFDNPEKPLYLQRLWCLFETYMAGQIGAKLSIIMPSEHADDDLRGTITAINRLCVLDSVATSSLDEHRIKERLISNATHADVNDQIKQSLTAWCTAHLGTLPESAPEAVPAAADLNQEDVELLSFKFAPAVEGRRGGVGKMTVKNTFGAGLRLFLREPETVEPLLQKKLDPGQELELFRIERLDSTYVFSSSSCKVLYVEATPADWDASIWMANGEAWTLNLKDKSGVVEKVLTRDWTNALGHRRFVSERLGVNLGYLYSTFPGVAKQACSKPNATFHDIAPRLAYGPNGLGAGLECPRDQRPNCSIVDSLKGAPVGAATHFLSWAWATEVSAFVSAMQSCVSKQGLDADSTFVWVCFFCNNQYRILEEKVDSGSDDLEKAFSQRLTDIGRVVVLFDNWAKPVYLTRVWCVFETYMAHQFGIDLMIIMPANQADSCRLEMRASGVDKVMAALSRVDCARASATCETDEQRVKGLIQKNSSFQEVNMHVGKKLGAWFTSQFQDLVDRAVAQHSRRSVMRPTTCEATADSSDDEINIVVAGLQSSNKALQEELQTLRQKVAEGCFELRMICGGIPAAQKTIKDLADLAGEEAMTLAIETASGSGPRAILKHSSAQSELC